MLEVPSIEPGPERELVSLRQGEPLLRRGGPSTWVLYLESGRVALGVMSGDTLEHQLGLAQGPCWLEAGAALLNLPHVVDAVAETPVSLRRVSAVEFRRLLSGTPAPALAVLQDLARAHRRQSEYAVSRLSKDAEARCAEWLLRQAQPSDAGGLVVIFQQRKRSIAAHLGIAPETLSRVLRHMRERSLTSGSGRTLNLLDPPGLRLLAGL